MTHSLGVGPGVPEGRYLNRSALGILVVGTEREPETKMAKKSNHYKNAAKSTYIFQ